MVGGLSDGLYTVTELVAPVGYSIDEGPKTDQPGSRLPTTMVPVTSVLPSYTRIWSDIRITWN